MLLTEGTSLSFHPQVVRAFYTCCKSMEGGLPKSWGNLLGYFGEAAVGVPILLCSSWDRRHLHQFIEHKVISVSWCITCSWERLGHSQWKMYCRERRPVRRRDASAPNKLMYWCTMCRWWSWSAPLPSFTSLIPSNSSAETSNGRTYLALSSWRQDRCGFLCP